MADLSQFLNGGGAYRLVSVSTNTIPALQTGTLITATAGANQLIKLTHCHTNTTSSEPSMSLVIDGNTAVSGTLGDTLPNSVNWYVSIGQGVTQLVDNIRKLSPPVGKAISLVKSAGDTVQSIIFNYEVWEKI